MPEPSAVVMITKSRGTGVVDSEVRVGSLGELYQVCRDAPPADLVRVLIMGTEGDVTLNFASFIHK